MPACGANKNLGPKARRGQLRAAVIVLGVTLAAGLAMVEVGAPAVYGWLLLLPMAFGTYTMFSGLFGVCIFVGARGARVADYGFEVVPDCSLRNHLRNRGVGVALASFTLAALATALFVVSASA
jgi:hypothetical protein